MSSSSSNTSTTTSLPFVNGSTEPVSDNIEHIRELLALNIPDVDADQDVGTLLRQLESADSVGQNVEGRIDVILERLDLLLRTLQQDGDPQTAAAEIGTTGLQKADKGHGC
ncbi:hypothetical protein B0F90DRAFT_1819203 [Multifurca ochricompacta]|uniref:Uncharacterized protein n=1 Tax=Multifurca ochricompacta TaxID=376703 RepID=A0AAD4M181_9AGAM|nr:hypothetical protein B0F90DRAFT_1819203 [Multifurca ochricompacta]